MTLRRALGAVRNFLLGVRKLHLEKEWKRLRIISGFGLEHLDYARIIGNRREMLKNDQRFRCFQWFLIENMDDRRESLRNMSEIDDF
jgi:hypothetical protein